MTNRSRAIWASTALLTSLAMSSAVHAQETTSAVRGEVVADNGSPVAGGSVTVTHLPSGTTLTTVTDGSGIFTARGLRPGGPYLIEVASDAGTGTLEDINLQVAETAALTVFVGGAASTVDDVIVVGVRDVTANNTGAVQVLDRDAVEAVVSVNRDIRDLARRNILVSQNTRGDGGISIAGSNPRTNRITIDGTQAQDDFGLNTGGSPVRRGPVSIDAIEQFSISAVPTDVENGDFQGGALDVVLRAGTNDFRGTVFTNYLNDGFVGDSIRGQDIPQQITQTNYGAFFSGPLWRDKLFFALSYELYESADQTGTGPVGAGFANDIRGITQANIDSFINDFNVIYASEFDVGNIIRTSPINDEKYSAKLDWNITDDQRLAFTYRKAVSDNITRTDLGTGTAALDSHYYLSGEDEEVYSLELNSRWSSAFSTQLRASYREYTRIQEPRSGQVFSDITVCGAATSVVAAGDTLTSCGPTSTYRFGPDQFRHANFLETSNAQVQAKGEYALGDNLFKFGYQGQFIDIFNLFVPSSDGVYYFDSLADFRTGRANRLVYNNALSGNPNDAAADFKYELHSLFAQDTLQLFDNLTLTAGVRYDFYRSDDLPANNINFAVRNGFDNQTTYDGIDIIQPRASFEWEATDWLSFNGGAGLFSGGLPDVFLSNSFSNTGVLTSQIDIQRTATNTFIETTGAPGFNQQAGADALNINVANPRFGFAIPASVQQVLGGVTVSPLSEVNALIPGFDIPSDWKYFLTATIEAPEGWASSFVPAPVSGFLDNWRVSLDAIFTETNKGLSFRDFRAQALTVRGVRQLTPDGRIRYDGLGLTAAQRAAQGISSVNLGSNRDIVAFNSDEGTSYTIALSASKSFDFGLDVLVGYARQNLEDLVSGARFSSTANSLYSSGATRLDPNQEAFGTGFEEIQNRYKAELTYTKEFFPDLQTRINLFGEIRSGRPISFVFNDVLTGRGGTFGVNRANHLFYVPDFANDADQTDLNVGFVTFNNATTRDQVRAFVNQFGLEQGRILDKGEGSDDQPETYQVDLSVSQELPVFYLPGKLRLQADVQNLTNLLNDEWGIVEEYSDTVRVVSTQCATSAGVASGSNSADCSRYLYSNFNPTASTLNRNNGQSLWAIQVSLRYSF